MQWYNASDCSLAARGNFGSFIFLLYRKDSLSTWNNFISQLGQIMAYHVLATPCCCFAKRFEPTTTSTMALSLFIAGGYYNCMLSLETWENKSLFFRQSVLIRKIMHWAGSLETDHKTKIDWGWLKLQLYISRIVILSELWLAQLCLIQTLVIVNWILHEVYFSYY